MINTLPKTFTKNGFNFTQLNRAGQVALYQRKASTFDYQDFEIVRVRNYQVDKDKVVEVYPSSNEWGRFAISKVDEKEALNEFNEWAAKFKDKEAEDYNLEAQKNLHKRGRHPLKIKIEFPEGEWGIKEIADKLNVSTGYINLRLKTWLKSGEVIKVESRKLVSGRGRKASCFKYVGKK